MGEEGGDGGGGGGGDADPSVLTILCEEEECETCEVDIDDIPVFVNDFGKKSTICLACGQERGKKRVKRGFKTLKTYKAGVIRCIIPEIRILPDVLNRSYPFCQECTDTKISKIVETCQQLELLQTRFDKLRGVVVRGICQVFVNDKGNEDKEDEDEEERRTRKHGRDAERLFKYWKRYVGYPANDKDDGQHVLDKEVLIPLPLATSDSSDNEAIIVKEEPPEEELQVDQTELLPVLHLGPNDDQVQEDQNTTENTEKTNLTSVREEFAENNVVNYALEKPESKNVLIAQPLDGAPDQESMGGDEPLLNARNKKKLKRLKMIPKSLIKKCQEDQLPVIHVNESEIVPHQSGRKRSIRRKLFLSRDKILSKNVRLKIVRTHNAFRAAASSGCDSDSSDGCKKMRLKARHKAIQTLIRDAVHKGSFRIDLITKRSHRQFGKMSSHRHSVSVSCSQELEEDRAPSPLIVCVPGVKTEPLSYSSSNGNMSDFSNPSSGSGSNSRRTLRFLKFRPSQQPQSLEHRPEQTKNRSTKAVGKCQQEIARKPLPRKSKQTAKKITRLQTKKGTKKGPCKPSMKKPSPKSTLAPGDHDTSSESDYGPNNGGSSPDMFDDCEDTRPPGSEHNAMELLKCTPNIIEGSHKLKIPALVIRDVMKSHNRSRNRNVDNEGFEMCDLPPPSFLDSDAEDEDNYVREVFSDPSRSTELKRTQNSKKRKRATDSDYDGDSSDDFTVGKSHKASKKKNKKRNATPASRSRPGKKDKAPNSSSSLLLTPGTTSRDRQPIRKHSTKSVKTVNAVPKLQGGDVVDLSTPANVTLLSNILTGSVLSVVGKMDPSPSPSRGRQSGSRSRCSSHTASLKDTFDTDDGSQSEVNDEQDVDFVENGKHESSSGSNGSKRESRPRERKFRRPPRKSTEAKPKPPKKTKEPKDPNAPPKKYERTRRESLCTECGKVLSSAWNLTIHMRTHKGDRRFVCPQEGCGKRFGKSENLRTHVRTHSKERPYKCDVCGWRFSVRGTLRQHKATKHNIYDSEAVYSCTACKEKTLTEYLMKKHFLKCTRRDHDGFLEACKVYCVYCDLNFSDVEDFKEHQKDSKHADIKAQKIQEARKDIAEYVKGDSKTEEIPCDQCNEKFQDSRLLQVHISKEHTAKVTGDTPICHICGKKFSSFGNLKIHVPIHSEFKAFVCEVCGAKFNQKGGLNVHMLSKHNDKPFKCQYCGEKMGKEKIYRRHLCLKHKDVHLREKKYFCKSCYVTFAEKEELEMHIESEHVDLRCQPCGKLYGNPGDLRNHIIFEHPEHPIPFAKPVEDGGVSSSSNDGNGTPHTLKKKGRPRKKNNTTVSSSSIRNNRSPPSSATSSLPLPTDQLIPRPLVFPDLNFDQTFPVISEQFLRHNNGQDLPSNYFRSHP